MILSSLAAVAMAQSASAEVRLVRSPDIHGDQYVFTYASDLWIGNVSGGTARRLTSHPGMETRAHFSPDGKYIAFSGSYDGGFDVYVIPSEGGEPKRLTYEANTDAVQGWTPDGKSIAYTSTYGNHTNRMGRLWLVDMNGGLPQRTDLQECSDLSFDSSGSKLAFTRSASHQFNWRLYRGGTQGRIAFWDMKDNSYSEIPAGREQNYFPMWVGDKVYYISDKNQNNLNLYVYDTKSKKVEQLTKFTDGDIRWPRTDGQSIIFERNLKLHKMDLASKQFTELSPRILGDNLSMRPRYMNVGNVVDAGALSPTGKRVIATARGELFSVPATTGTTRNLSSTPGARERAAEWSADGQWVYYITDASGEDRIVRQPQMGGKVEEIKTAPGKKLAGFIVSNDGNKLAYTTTDLDLFVMDLKSGVSDKVRTDLQGNVPFEFSPDSKWIVYLSSMPNLSTQVRLYDIAGKKSHMVTEGFFGDNAVSFDQSGKYLYFVSSRTFGASQNMVEGVGLEQNNMMRVYGVTLSKSTPDPLLTEGDEEPVKSDGGEAGNGEQPSESKIDLEGISKRVFVLPLPASNYFGLTGVQGGFTYVDESGSLMMFSLRSKRASLVMPGIQGLSFNPARTKFLYQSGPVMGISDLRPGVEPGTGRVNLGDMGMMVDPAAEYKQMFGQVWRYQRDQFYDPGMMGVDWDAIGKKYEAMLDNVGDRSDLDYIFGQMIGELGTGHAYVQPGPTGADPMSPPAAYLGADFESVGDKVRFKKIYRGSVYDPQVRGPLGALGVDVNDGDYLLAINGKAVTTKTGVSAHLLGLRGKRIKLTVGSQPGMAGSREVEVTGGSDETLLRYEAWVDERRAMIDELSNGQIGYMHVPDTSIPGIIGFVKGYYATMDKKAWIIDERYNGGGSIPTFFIEYLSREFTNVIRPRHGQDVGLPLSLNGPKAMLINEHAGSGGDLFPYLFKKAGLGPLIGTRTWGGLVGIQGFDTLIDGGGVTAPGFGIYDPQTGKWIAENTGVDPDIQVDDRPDMAAMGKDVQLERGVQYLLEALKTKKPWKSPSAFPKIGN